MNVLGNIIRMKPWWNLMQFTIEILGEILVLFFTAVSEVSYSLTCSD